MGKENVKKRTNFAIVWGGEGVGGNVNLGGKFPSLKALKKALIVVLHARAH